MRLENVILDKDVMISRDHKLQGIFANLLSSPRTSRFDHKIIRIRQEELSLFNNKETFKQVFTEQLVSRLGKGLEEATAEDVYKTLGGMIREYVGREWAAANRIYRETGQKQVYYFSLEF